MNLDTFLGHHGIVDNPFLAEEARHDEVFARLEQGTGPEFRHPDFGKICGDLNRPSSAVVFGERGAGKTALRVQLERRIRDHNHRHPDRRVLGVAYDDFDAPLRAMEAATGLAGSTDKLFGRLTLADHMDAILHVAVPALVDGLLEGRRGGAGVALDLDDDAARTLRRLDLGVRRDLLLLQACYDRPEGAARRLARLRRAARLRTADPVPALFFGGGTLLGAALVLLIWSIVSPPEARVWAWNSAVAVLGLAGLALAGWGGWRWLMRWRLARGLARSLRTVGRSAESYRRALAMLPPDGDLSRQLPHGQDDEGRFAMFRRLLGVLRALGHSGLVVIVDRVDEPTLVAGEPARMQALVWPLFSSKLLQQEGVGFKLLLPLELRHFVNRETTDFFRSARLDKGNLVERLSWPGTTLYDLCNARLNACRAADAQPISVMDLFDESMRPQDVVDALDQLQQPRDAFKFLYQCIQEHCAATPEEAPQWRISRALFDAVRKRQVERMQEMLKGVRAG